VPRIDQRYLDCVIYLYRSVEAAKAGEGFGGSGCLISVASEFGYEFPDHIYAVTNKHVVQKGFPVVRLNTVDGNTEVLPLKSNDWIQHQDGDDLAVAPLDLFPHIQRSYFPISNGYFLHREQASGTGWSAFGAGDDTFMVGRFIDHAGNQRNTPSLRFGSIAMLPFEKVKLADGYMQEAFLVETRSMRGYSGAPVFVYRPELSSRHRTVDYWGNKRYEQGIADVVGTPTLLGIDCGHWPKHKQVGRIENNKFIPHHQWKVESNTGLAIVIPAWRLSDLLNRKELAMQRRQKDHEYQDEKEAEETVAPDTDKPERNPNAARFRS